MRTQPRAGAREMGDGRDGQGRPVRAGIYLYRLEGHAATGRLVILR